MLYLDKTDNFFGQLSEIILVINRTIKYVSIFFCNKLDTDLLQYFNRYITRHLLAESLLSGDWQQTEFLKTNTKYNV